MPEEPGVYQYFNEVGEVIYVGKAKNLKRRVSSYFHKEQDRYKTEGENYVLPYERDEN